MKILDKISGLLFPLQNSCLLCKKGASYGSLCPKCRAEIITRHDFTFCPVCGRYQLEVSSTKQKHNVCQECRETTPRFLAAKSLGPFRGALKEAIYLYKYGGHRSLSIVFGQLLAELLLDEPGLADTDLLIPVPLSQEKAVTRGFNQSELLAVKIGKILNLPVSNDLVRVRNTPSQSKLARKARMDNIKGAFALSNKISGGNVVLIDDILTTGATAGECAGVLLQAGVQKVTVLTLASGIQEKDNYLF